MRTCRVAELEGALLDAAVAQASSISYRLQPLADGLRCMIAVPDNLSRGHVGFRPSTDWETGGPIIERERISVVRGELGEWHGYTGQPQRDAGDGEGPTALIAAMRAFVATSVGEEIELP